MSALLNVRNQLGVAAPVGSSEYGGVSCCQCELSGAAHAHGHRPDVVLRCRSCYRVHCESQQTLAPRVSCVHGSGATVQSCVRCSLDR